MQLLLLHRCLRVRNSRCVRTATGARSGNDHVRHGDPRGPGVLGSNAHDSGLSPDLDVESGESPSTKDSASSELRRPVLGRDGVPGRSKAERAPTCSGQSWWDGASRVTRAYLACGRAPGPPRPWRSPSAPISSDTRMMMPSRAKYSLRNNIHVIRVVRAFQHSFTFIARERCRSLA